MSLKLDGGGHEPQRRADGLSRSVSGTGAHEATSPTPDVDALRAFLFEVGRSAGQAPTPNFARGAAIMRREGELVDELLRGLGLRFGSRDPRQLLQRRAEWFDAAAGAFNQIEAVCQPGAGRALWAQLARALSAGLPDGAKCPFGPIVGATYDARSPQPLAAPLDVDTVVVSIRSGGRNLCVVELPVYQEVTLGGAFPRHPKRGLLQLTTVFNGGRLLRLAGKVLRASRPEWSGVALAVGRANGRAGVRVAARNTYERLLAQLTAPLFGAGTPSARRALADLEARVGASPAGPPIAPPFGRRSPLGRRRSRNAMWRVPVLMYHRITDHLGPPRFRTSPDMFQRQMDALKALGYCAVTSSELLGAYRSGLPLPGRAIMITFDDGYADFAIHAHPALRSRELTAEVFLVTDLVGDAARWDAHLGTPAPLMDWTTIRELFRAGVRFGSHLATHTPVTHMTSGQLFAEASRSRRRIECELNCAVCSMAVPYGLYDDRLPHVLGWSGYSLGFSTDAGHAESGHDPLRLPRLEVSGDLTLDDFRALLR